MRGLILAVISVLVLALAAINWAACYHDNAIMREKIAAIECAQVEQAAEIRKAKTDAEIALRVVTTGEFAEGEK